MRYITLLFVIMSFSAQAQKTKECNPYFEIPKYELSDVKHYSMGYLACIHATGLIAEVGYDNMFVGVLAMGKGHHHTAYTFFQYEYLLDGARVYIGPAYRLNNNPSLLIGRFGIDVKIYKGLHGSLALLQVNQYLNYLHFGLKLNY